MTIAAAPSRHLSQIKVGIRHRKDFGDLASLARAIDKEGLLQPIAITPDNTLIAGERRLRAWQITRFKDQEIPVHVVDLDEIVRGEWSENANRKDFTPSEMVAIKRALEPKLKAEAEARMTSGVNQHSEPMGKFPEGSKGRAADKLGAFVHKDRKTIEKMAAVVAAAEADPARFGKLVEDMDRTGRVEGPYKRLRNIKAADQIKTEPSGLPMHGPYRAGLIDVPWASEPDQADKDHGARGYYPYPTMTPKQVAAMPVPSILHADASVFLWITNFHLMHGHHLTIAEAWGLRPVALFTWIKRKWGQGQRARGATEHLIQMVRGNVLILGSDTKTWFEGDGGIHSQKPRQVYEEIAKSWRRPRAISNCSAAALLVIVGTCTATKSANFLQRQSSRSPPRPKARRRLPVMRATSPTRFP
jgi:N6-adenosine-specific RNA methylase IME4